MINQPYVPRKAVNYFSQPLIFPLNISRPACKVVSYRRVMTTEFFVLSDGMKKVYRQEDAIADCGFQQIINPDNASYMNLFINGVLQPKVNYCVTEGKLVLLTEDIPVKGCPIVLQMIQI